MSEYIELPSGKLISNEGILMVDKVLYEENMMNDGIDRSFFMILYRTPTDFGSATSVMMKYIDHDKAMEDHDFLVEYLR